MLDWSPELRRRLASLRLDPGRESEILDEMSQHLDQRYEELLGAGATEEQARARAIEELLEPEALARSMRPLRQANMPPPVVPGAPRRNLLGDLGQDLRLAARSLRRQPAFTLTAVLTVALGIGANSAIFALVDATLLRPLPLPEPDRLVAVAERTTSSPQDLVSPLNLRDWEERSRSFARLAGFAPNVASMVMSRSDGTAETIPRQWVTAGFFEVLGVSPVVGRTFRAEDDRQGTRMVVLEEAFWRSRFDADPRVVGTELRLDGSLFTVAGVVPAEAQLFGRTSIWALVTIDGAPPRARGAHVFQAAGRLRPGVTLDAARAELAGVAEGLAREFPETNAGRGVAVEPLHDVVIGGDLRQTSMLFLGVVGFVLLICCANVANLLLARGTVRRRELAIRSALGADRSRLVRQLLTESLVLAAAGGALGLLVGAIILRVAPSVMPPDLLPPTVSLGFDGRIVAFCAAAALAAGLLFGVAPAWQATRLAPAKTLAGQGRSTTSRSGARNLLVAAEVATAVVLLFGAGLLLRTLVAVEGVDRGYRAESVLTMLVDPHGSRYPTDAALLQFYDEVEREVRAIPGVRDAGWATTLPLGTSYEGQLFFEVAGAPSPVGGRSSADYQIVSPTYFRALDLPVVAGRGFDERDVADAPAVCMVNEAFVRRHLGGRPPIGARIALRSDDSADGPSVVREIVGVARQVKGRPDEAEELVQVYVPLAQDATGDVFLLVRPEAGDAAAVSSAVRAAIGRVDKDQLVSVRDVATLEQVAWQATSRHRFRAVLVGAFASLALVLAMIGLFGIVAWAVQQRVRDVGVRKALGAGARDVLDAAMGVPLRVAAAGGALGLVLALALGRLLSTMLFGVRPLDPVTLAAVPVVLVMTAAVAVAAPARRALRIDPAVALRSE